jgi:hypothetical protein
MSTLSIPQFTHVAVANSVGGFFHVTRDEVAGYIYAPDFRKQAPGRYLAIRNEKVAQLAINDPREFDNTLNFHLGQRYIDRPDSAHGARKFLESNNPLSTELETGETYCSKLVNDWLQIIAPSEAIKRTSPKPVHFERLSDSDNWNDVTQNHLSYYEMIDSWDQEGHTDIRRLIKDDRAINSLLRAIEMTPGASGLDELPPPLEYPVKYWDDKKGDRA